MTIPGSGTARVLQVEDNEADVRLTREALREAGEELRFSVVGDGEQALAYLRNEASFEDAPRPRRRRLLRGGRQRVRRQGARAGRVHRAPRRDPGVLARRGRTTLHLACCWSSS